MSSLSDFLGGIEGCAGGGGGALAYSSGNAVGFPLPHGHLTNGWGGVAPMYGSSISNHGSNGGGIGSGGDSYYAKGGLVNTGVTPGYGAGGGGGTTFGQGGGGIIEIFDFGQ